MRPAGRPPRLLVATMLVAGLVLVAPAGSPQSVLEEEPPFPKHDEVMAALHAHADHPWVNLHLIGASEEGREIWLAEITDPESPVPMRERVVTFIFTQQHGNEPAGTPAALDVLDEVTSGGDLAGTLSNQVLLLLPMANPDGAEVVTRGNKDGVDVNRDHIALHTMEGRVLHDVLNRWDVHVAADHHEYGGIGTGNPNPVRVYDYDLTTLHPRHGNVRAPTVEMAERLQEEGVWPAAEEAGYTVNWYGELTVAGHHADRLAGGPDPGISRNHLGLHNVAGMLVESRVDSHPNPFHDAARRVDIHKVVMTSTLQYAHENADAFIAAKRDSGRLAVEEPASQYVEGERTGPLADAYLVSNKTAVDVDKTFLRHGLSPGQSTLDGVAYPMTHELQGHAAALLHPESSRAIARATPTDLDAMEDPVTLAGGERATPAPAAVLAAVAILAAGGIRARGARRS